MKSGPNKLLVLFVFIGLFFSADAQTRPFELPQGATSLGSAVNSGQTELAPILNPDGQTLYFVRRGHPKNFGNENKDDIWMVQRLQNGQWSHAINCGAPLNNSANNRVVGINPNTQQLYLLDNYQFNQPTGLAYSQRQGRQWSRPRQVELPGFSSLSKKVSFCLNAYGNVLIQSMERADGQGKNDLYISFLNASGEWTVARSLGEVINTPELEENPFLAYDNKTLYFSSRGHGGQGGADLFVSYRLDESWTNWSEPINLETVNTPADDRFLCLSAKGADAIVCYPDSSGKWDLFEIALPETVRPKPVVLLNGQIINAQTSKPVQAELGFRALDEPENLENFQAGPDGSFTLVVPYGDNLSLQAEVDGYFSVSEPMELANQNLKESDHAVNNALASLSLNSAYLQRDIEISQLNLQQKKLDEELKELNAQYEAFRKKMTRDLHDNALPVNYKELTDPELETLRHRYGNYFHIAADTIPKDVLRNVQDTISKDFTIKGGSAIPEDMVVEYDELEDMKRRFRTHYEQTRNSTEAPEEFIWENAKGLEDFQEEVRSSLRKELRTEVVNDLIEEESQNLAYQHLYDDIKRQQMQKEEAEMKAEIQASFALPFQDITQVAQVREEEWQQQLRSDLREMLVPEVKKELKEQLREDIRTAMQNKANYVVKSAEAEALQKEIDHKVLQQIREEEQSDHNKIDPLDAPSAPTTQIAKPTNKELSKVVLLMPVEVDQVIPLHNIFFNPNTAVFKSSSYAELNRVVEFMLNHPNIKVEIGGHTNGLLSHSQATQLSNKRAKAVSNYLTTYKVPNTQITYKGYGKTQPIASNETLEGRKLNQRIEMRILDVK
ncbi:MAG: hypothetical protein DHS20C18_05130 [Saprospiraceae bacterium]|nr:MAG: hypothetical protein DHS20C18_05130 [Saprospiraceae bacterium]